ncbi:MAG: Lrp/AsnC family transcriptional regulator [Flavobacteriales bacterium]
MDKIDAKILEFLQEDAKLTAKEMAAKLNLTPTPIYERIKKLENQGVIKSYVALLDPTKVNKGLTVFLNITIKEHHLDYRRAFVEDMKRLTDITELYHTSGRYDFLAKVKFANINDYKNFLINDLTDIKNIGNIDSQIVLDELKSTTKINLIS